MPEISDSFANEIIAYLRLIAENSNPDNAVSRNYSGNKKSGRVDYNEVDLLNKARIGAVEEEFARRKKLFSKERAIIEELYTEAKEKGIENADEERKQLLKNVEEKEKLNKEYLESSLKNELKISEEMLNQEDDLQNKKIAYREYIAQLESAKRKMSSDADRKEFDKKIKESKKAMANLDAEQSKLDANSSKNSLNRFIKNQEYKNKKLEEADKLREMAAEASDEDELKRLKEETKALALEGYTWFSQSNSGIGGFLNSLTKDISSALSGALNSVNKEINNLINDAVGHRQKIMTRLQGYGPNGGEFDYGNLLEDIRDNLRASPYILQTDFLKKLDEAVEKGIAYNVEQRTFLATISDKIATTFDAFNSELLRLIKLQQADSTAARLGMEAALTRNLNSMFGDTSYLTDNVRASVSASLLEAESLMTHQDAVELEYTAQKWLSAMYSLGASTNTISKIAEGLGKLGTGNVTSLAGDASTQTLFAMAASRANLDYAQMLVDGLDSSEVNRLLKSMVEYLQQISEDSRNNVVRSAYGDLYNISLADLRAVSSLTQSDINNLFSSGLTYDEATGELQRQLATIGRRYSTGDLINNMLSNFKYSVATDIADNAVGMTVWQITDFINNATGGIHLPAISVMGNMIDLSAFTVEGLLQGAIVGLSTLGQMFSILGDLGSPSSVDLSRWTGQEYNTRGGLVSTTNGFTTSISQSTYVASGSAEDMKKSALSGATEDAEDVGEITSAGTETEHTFDEFYNTMYLDKEPVAVSIESFGQSNEILNSLIQAIISLGELRTSTIDVNVTNAEVPIPMTITSLESSLKNEIITYINDTASDIIAEKIKTISLGYDSSDTANTVSKVLAKLNNGDAEITVKDINDTDFESLVRHLQLWGGLF